MKTFTQVKRSVIHGLLIPLNFGTEFYRLLRFKFILFLYSVILIYFIAINFFMI